MRFLRIGIFAISGLLVSGSLARAQIGYDDDVLTIYPTVSFDFDIWNSSPFDYQSYSVISTGYVAWDQAEQALIDVWNDWEYVPYMSTLTLINHGSFFYFGPGGCLQGANSKWDLAQQEIPLGNNADCFSEH